MNFKRKRTKRRVKCTLCTKYRWLGNNKGRSKAKYEMMKEDIRNV